MALAVVQHVMGNTGVSDAVLTVTITSTGTGNLLVVVARCASASAIINSVSDGTNSFTQAPTARGQAGGALLSCIDTWYFLSSTSGKTTITITWDTVTSNKRAEVWEVSGWTTCAADGGNALSDQTGSGSDYTGAAITTTGTVGFAVGGIIANLGAGTFTNPKAGNEYTAGGDTTGGNAYCSLISSSAATHTPVWTGSTNDNLYCTTAAAFKETAGGGSVALTGTATGSITETDVRNGGKTIILTLTGDTYVAAGTGPIGSIANTQSLIAGIDSAQAEATGWDALVKVAIRIPGDVVRTSGTVATITLPGVVDYNITAQETVTVTVPGAVLTGANPLVATPTFTVASDGSTPDFQDLTGAMVGM